MAYDFNSLTKQAPEATNRDGFYTDFGDVDPSKLHQISELTNWMRTKAKGSDVREVIAQLFERTWVESIKEGNANLEVAQARGSYPNLKSRLDNVDNKQQKTTEQLAQKANKDEVTNVMTPKGTLAYASLPTSGNQVGWYYYCPDGDGVHGAGNYVWNGTSWFFGGTGDEGYNLLKKDLADISDVYFDAGFENYSVTTDLIETEDSTRLISAKVKSNKNLNPQNQIRFKISDGYEFRVLRVKGNLGSYTDWLTEIEMGEYYSNFDYLRFAVRNRNNTSASITKDEVSIDTNIKEFIHYKKSATKEEVNELSKRVKTLEDQNNCFNLNIVSTGKENMMWSWWYYPQAFSFKRVRNKIYWGYTTADGYTGIAEYNENTHEIKKNHLKKSDIDDHNGLAVYILPNGTIMCAYSGGHNTDKAMHIRLSSVPECIDSFEDEICLESAGSTSYGQIVYAGGKYWLFYRVDNGTWAYRTTTDGKNWTPEVLLLYSAVQYYCRFVQTTDNNIIRMVMASNPGEESAMIRQCFINIDEGKIYDNDMTTVLGSINEKINKNNVSVIIPLETDKTQRLFDVAITEPSKTLILYCTFKTSSNTDSEYFLYDSGNKYKICSGGEALWYPKYQDGCAFINASEIISIRGYEGSDIVEIYTYADGSVTKNKQVYSEIKGNIPIRNARPIVDVNGKYAVWHRGYYNTANYKQFNSDAKLYDIINDNII